MISVVVNLLRTQFYGQQGRMKIHDKTWKTNRKSTVLKLLKLGNEGRSLVCLLLSY